MDYLHVENLTRPANPKIQAGLCRSFFSRFRGLMLRPPLEPGEGIVIDEGSDSLINAAIHMLFMRFAITVIWIDSKMTVVDRAIALPWKLYYAPHKPARYIVEAHIDRYGDFQNGDLIAFKTL